MKDNCTGVILAGGLNRRLPGKKKTFHKIGNQMILDTIYNAFRPIFQEIIIVVNDPLDFLDWDLMVARDIIPTRNALAGLHTGLFYSSNDYAYVTACDTPFINTRVIEYMIDQIQPGDEVIVPRTDDGLEPLSAVYSKSCIPMIEKNLAEQIFMIKRFFKKARVKEIPVATLKELDPAMEFIFNINTPNDLDRARKMALNGEQV